MNLLKNYKILGAVLCCAVLCCAVLCCAVLHSTLLLFISLKNNITFSI
ncbi:hypothetical protein R4I97_11120 [Brachyspira pilosicoli]